MRAILLEHAEYLYTYPEGEPRPRLEAGSALALAGCVCASLPQSELWRLAGFGRVAAVLAEVAPAPTDVHLTLPLDVAFSLANERDLPILERAVPAYNTVLNRNFTPEKPIRITAKRIAISLMCSTWIFPGMEAVKAAVLAVDIPAAKSAYTAFRRQFLKDFVGGACPSRLHPVRKVRYLYYC